MMDRHTSREDETPPSRPLRQAAVEIVAMSVPMVAIALVLATPDKDGGVIAMFRQAARAGETAVHHIGWAFGVIIPTLLGFYAIVIGGPLVASPSAVHRTRRLLALVAEFMTAAIVPALLAIFAVCLTDADHAGAMLVLVPATALLFFLAIQLGRFNAFTRSQRLEVAERSREWARQRLSVIGPRSRRPGWMVVLANVVVCAGGTFALTVLAGGHAALPARAVFALTLTSLMGASASAFLTYNIGMAESRGDRVLAWIVACVGYLAIVLLAIAFFRTSGAIGAAFVVIGAFCAVSTWWPRARAQVLAQWTIRAGANWYATRSAVYKHRQAVKEVRELATP